MDVAELKDFVDRIEVVYVWSQFMRLQGADLPGRDVLARLIADGEYVFGGKEWGVRRERRALSKTNVLIACNSSQLLAGGRFTSITPGSGVTLKNFNRGSAGGA